MERCDGNVICVWSFVLGPIIEWGKVGEIEI